MGGKSKEEGIYVYMWLIHFAVQEKLTQHCKPTILQLKKTKNKTTATTKSVVNVNTAGLNKLLQSILKFYPTMKCQIVPLGNTKKTQLYTHTCTYMHTYVCTPLSHFLIYKQSSVYVCVIMCVCVCVCVHTYIRGRNKIYFFLWGLTTIYKTVQLYLILVLSYIEQEMWEDVWWTHGIHIFFFFHIFFNRLLLYSGNPKGEQKTYSTQIIGLQLINCDRNTEANF